MNATTHVNPAYGVTDATPYPVNVTIQEQLEHPTRWHVALRPILAIPHAILVGPIFGALRSGAVGLLGAAAYVMAIVSWFTLLFGNRQLGQVREFSLFYLRWRVRALAYMALLRDEYPPFGEGEYPASMTLVTTEAPRDKFSIALRPILAIPHLIAVAVLLMAAFFATIAAWVVVLVTCRYPVAIYRFVAGVIRWTIRTEAYMLLLVDEFPPFTLQ